MEKNLSHTFEYANDFYIHYNKMNIGLKGNRNILTKTYAEQKKQVSLNLVNQYKNLFNNTLKRSTVQTLGKVMDITEDQFLTIANKYIEEKLQKQLRIDKLESLHQIVVGGNLSNLLSKAVDKKNMEALNEAFEIVVKAINLIDSDNNSLGAILLDSLNGATNFSEIGKNLSNKLKQYSIKNKMKLIRKQSLESIKNQLENLAYVLQTGKFKSTGADLTAKGLSTLLVNNIISTNIAEGLAFSMNNKAGNLLYKTIAQSTGTKQVKVNSDNQDEIKITGKTDVQIKNVNTHISIDDNKDSVDINIDLYFSSKFYTGQGFNSTLQDVKGSYGSGSGGSLAQAIQLIWGDAIDRYLVYNYVTHDIDVYQINDLIATRQIIRLFASAGQQDFSHFMLLNGKIVSIWSIIQYAISSNLFLSKSQNGAASQGIVISIPDRKKIHQTNIYREIGNGQTKTTAAWKRSHDINQVIRSSTIFAKIHLKNLAAAYNKI